MLVKPSTNTSASEAAAALQTAALANHFGVMQLHNLKETMAKKSVAFTSKWLIFDVCQPQPARKVPPVTSSAPTPTVPAGTLRPVPWPGTCFGEAAIQPAVI